MATVALITAGIGLATTATGGGISIFQARKARLDTLQGVEAEIVKLTHQYAKTTRAKKRERLAEKLDELYAKRDVLRAELRAIEATAAASSAGTVLPPPATGATSRPSLGTALTLVGLFALGAAAVWYVWSAPGSLPSRSRRKKRRARAA